MQDFNLIALAGIGALALIIASPLVLVLGGAAEALYLINAPGSVWFERYLTIQRARRRGVRRIRWRREIEGRLPRSARQQVRDVQERLAMAMRSLDTETRLLAQAELDRVEDLLDELIALHALRVTATQYLATMNPDDLMRETRAVTNRLRAVRDDRVLTGVEQQRLDVLQKRLAERQEMERNVEIVESQISTLEHSVGYLADKLVSWSAAGHEPQGLREILAGVESTEQAIEQVRPVLQQIERVRQG